MKLEIPALLRKSDNETKSQRFLRIAVVSFAICFILMVVFCIGLITFVSIYSKGLPDVENLSHFEPSESSQIFSSDGKVIGELFKEHRLYVPIADIPQDMQDAILAVEDSRFYQHHGVDFRGIARALYENFRGGSVSQGASTITQQLARNIFLSSERSMKRKIQEMLLSIQIERRYTKKEILELYLNQIYFGAGAYGIEAAAYTYFGKHAKQLTLPECAIIAGLPAAPSAYSPLVDEKASQDRQKVVLNRMEVCEFITAGEKERAIAKKLRYAAQKTELQNLKYPYFTSYVLKELSSRYDDEVLYRGGLRIYTTLNVKIQNAATEALRDGLQMAIAKNMNTSNGALVAIDPRNGHIKAMVGGLKYTEKNQFNRAWQARRQPGSAFKVFIFTAAIDCGYSPDALLYDTQVTYNIVGSDPWTPKNSDGSFWGAMTVRDSLKWSRNVCAVKLLDKIGVDRVIDYAQRMGIRDPIEHNLAIALGSSVVTPLDMASAFGVLANGGIRCEPTTIKKILDSKGKVIEDNSTPRQNEIVQEATAYAMTEMLMEVINSGTGTGAQIGRPAAGKTGTTDAYRDAWFVGYVPELSCAVWTGNDDFSRMNRVYGGELAAPIWAQFMKKALAGQKPVAFSSNGKGQIGVYVCAETGLRATGSCPDKIKVFKGKGEIPRQFCSKHGPLLAYRNGKKPGGKKGHEPRTLPDEKKSPEVSPTPEESPDKDPGRPQAQKSTPQKPHGKKSPPRWGFDRQHPAPTIDPLEGGPSPDEKPPTVVDTPPDDTGDDDTIFEIDTPPTNIDTNDPEPSSGGVEL